jgi:hypothetical protein
LPTVPSFHQDAHHSWGQSKNHSKPTWYYLINGFCMAAFKVNLICIVIINLFKEKCDRKPQKLLVCWKFMSTVTEIEISFIDHYWCISKWAHIYTATTWQWVVKRCWSFRTWTHRNYVIYWYKLEYSNIYITSAHVGCSWSSKSQLKTPVCLGMVGILVEGRGRWQYFER